MLALLAGLIAAAAVNIPRAHREAAPEGSRVVAK
jgi:hypothetical protein